MPHSLVTRACTAIGVGVVVASLFSRVSAGPAEPPALAVPALLTTASNYVDDYQSQLTYLIASEDYTQRRVGSHGRLLGSRDLRGELFLAFVPDDHEWVAVHDVISVDGKSVSDREDLQTLLHDSSVASVAQRLKDRNARFNIGAVKRNFNEPTFALQALAAKNASRFRFSRSKVTRGADGVTFVTLAFKEVQGPALVVGRDNHDIFSSGEVTMEAETGRVLDTSIVFKDGGIEGRLATTYAPDSRLGLLVPTTFTERWAGDGETVTGEARYLDFHRFEVVSRMK
jgi:hypothetical protein